MRKNSQTPSRHDAGNGGKDYYTGLSSLGVSIGMFAMNSSPTFSKMDVARANLRAAIQNHFARSHPATVETLNGAANTVLRDLARKKGISGAIHDTDFFDDENRKKWVSVLHEPQNFHKHADKEPADATLGHNSLITNMLIVESCQLFRLLSGDYENFKDEIELLVFEIWFILKYPWVADDLEFINHHPFGPDLRTLEVDDFPAWIHYIDSRRS
jgi:hypothetical protein